MSPNWVRVQELFLAAVDLPARERGVFLENACGGDANLRGEVEALLAHDDPQGDSLRELVGDAAHTFIESKQTAGSRLGPWRILKNISTGGMGMVYLAERADGQYRQQVAVKLIRPGFETGENLARFHRERQILAEMRHPYIAHLIDGGMTEDGRPFLVMEYIEGEPVHEYVKSAGLSVDAVCRLFAQVCEAVAYAHSNGVVHRDLKPSNILVCKDGSPRLLDFGIAKLLDAKVDTGLTQTASGVMLTPDYASPEQVMGQEITPATDVYCLGGILFTVLTGEKPHRIPRQDALEIRRAICETDVVAPSTLVDGARRKQVAGDLDAITLKAMRKEPGRRYRSVEELREDVARHLEMRPVAARAGVWSYRASRFVRRHPGWLALAALALAGLAAAAVIVPREARREEAVRLYEAARADFARGEEVRVPQVIADLQRAIELRPDYAPAYTALAQASLWFSWRKHNAPEARRQLVEDARAAATRAIALDARQAPAHATMGDILFFQDWRWKLGEQAFRDAVRLEPANVRWQVDYVKALTVLGRFEEGLQRLEAAERTRPGEMDYQVQRALMYFYLHRWDESIAAARQVAERDPNGVDGVWVLGMALVQAGRTQEGIRALESGLNRHRRDTRLEAALGNAYGFADDRANALRILGWVERPPSLITAFRCLVCGALVHAGLGDADAAMDWLYRARESGDNSLPFVPADPRYRRIAGDKRFQELVAWIRKGRE